MYNNALFGFMVQKIICKKFNIKVTSTRLKNTFDANNEERLVSYIKEIVDNIFDKLNLKPVSCTTFNVDENNKEVPYNFILSDNSTLSIRTNRSFKFRFIMKNFIPLLISKRNNTETIGITAEKTICDIFNLKCPNNFSTRYSPEVEYQLEDVIKSAFSYLPKPIAHSGSTIGDRGGNSKCSYDFVLEGNKTLSLKTNIGKMVCPPEVGQPNDKTCYLYFKHLIDADHIDNLIFKNMVFNHIEEMMPIYLEHMFDSDYLLWLFIDKKNVINTGSIYNYEIFPKSLGMDFKWEKDKFSFSKKNIDEWNEKPIYDESTYVTLGQAIAPYMTMPENPEINHVFSKHTKEMQERLAAIPEGKSLYKNYSDAWKKSPWDKPSCTIKENHGGTNVHPKLPRCLTARELATLQSFPADFIFKGSKKWQLVQIGNAVPPLMGKAIGLAVKKMLDE